MLPHQLIYDCSNTISVANRSVQSEGFVTIMRSASFRVKLSDTYIRSLDILRG